MKIFTNNGIWKKLVISFLVVFLFEYLFMRPPSFAKDENNDVLEFGGKLATPIASFLVTVGDGAMHILHSSIMGINNPLIHVDTGLKWYEKFLSVIISVISIAAGIALIVATGRCSSNFCRSTISRFRTSFNDARK